MATRLRLRDVPGTPLTPVRVLDIGALTEGADRYRPLVTQGLAEVTGFEPDDASREALSRRHGPYRYLPQRLADVYASVDRAHPARPRLAASPALC